MQIKHLIGIAALAMCSTSHTISAYAQAAGAGADFNKADRKATAKETERQRVEKIDKPIRPDPVGNALIGGGVTGVMTGAARGAATGAAAGAASAARGAAIGTAVEKAKEKK